MLRCGLKPELLRLKNTRAASRQAFVSIELLVVIAFMVLLACLHVSARARGGGRAKLVQCFNNARLLQHTALIYADDNDGVLPPNAPAGAPPNSVWVPSTFMNWTTSPANTNTASLLNTDFARYGGRDFRIYKCPADTERAANGDRLRSFSMNSQMGHIETTIPGPIPIFYTPPNYNPGWRVFKRTSDFHDLHPARLFVFIEEHPDSINDGHFQVNMSMRIFPSVPGSNHDGAGTLSFADGHVEWKGWETRPTVRKVALANLNATTNDWRWLSARTTAFQP
jgi:prepilin-type processing-associated H-X9-DG protein